MRNFFITFVIALISNSIIAQSVDSSYNIYQSSADRLLSADSRFILGGYGEVHYNQPLNSGVKANGTLDVHRMVMLLGYNFNSKTQFITEIEYEHVSEVFIEQAFLQYKFRNFLTFRAGLMLIPMGIVNEYHEPVAFNGVERPVIDTRISPTTWREIGIGITGNISAATLKYQLYLINGFNGYDGNANLNGKNGLRNGRQKGAESYISAPNISGRIEYYGFRGLNLGVSGYFGKSQSTMYSGLDKTDKAALASADSSVTGIAMTGLDARYQKGGLQLRGQFYYTSLSNTAAFNQFTASDGLPNDLGSALLGYYLEAGYDVLHSLPKSKFEFILFGRYEQSNTHFSTAGSLEANKSYDLDIITCGLSMKLAKGAVVKADMQFLKSAADSEFSTVFNAGIGVMF